MKKKADVLITKLYRLPLTTSGCPHKSKYVILELK
jgi:hypothetical protein